MKVFNLRTVARLKIRFCVYTPDFTVVKCQIWRDRVKNFNCKEWGQATDICMFSNTEKSVLGLMSVMGETMYFSKKNHANTVVVTYLYVFRFVRFFFTCLIVTSFWYSYDPRDLPSLTSPVS